MKISLVKPVSGYNLAAINDNFVKLEQELQDKVLYRDNPVGEPNAVVTDLDMNGKRILNLSELQVGGVNISGLNSAVVWRGTWSGATAYARNDAVYHSGSSYICVTPNTNSTPPSANWNLLASQGSTGAGSGDVLGPASATLDTIATYASGTGKVLKASGLAISSLALAGPIASSGIIGAAFSGPIGSSGITGAATSSDLDALRDVSSTSVIASYTLGLGDRGKSIDFIGGTSQTITIPSNASVVFPVGAVVTITNNSVNNLLIAITTDTLRLAGTATVGTRTLAQYGVATARKVSSTVWIISGSGLT